MNAETGRVIGDKVGKAIEVEIDEDSLAVGSYLRVKMLMDVRKPLFQGVTMEVGEEGNGVWCDVILDMNFYQIFAMRVACLGMWRRSVMINCGRMMSSSLGIGLG
uniref:Uncharacterized protein n=1 Tax=Arundo donax TaxID=35708 RepID=A0A0A8YXH1_ARUDO